MLTHEHRDRIWASLHEPRALTVVAVLSYLFAAVTGAAVIAVTFHIPGDQARDITLVALGVVGVLAGLVGVPAAWRGYHHREVLAALLLPLMGALVMTDAAMLLTDPDPLRVRVVLLAAYGGVAVACLGASRYMYLRHAGPYAPGKGPQTAEHRIVAAQMVMESQDREVEARAAAAATTKGA
ncbi:hypothetical protein LG274_02730 [Micrococcus antarcticus]|uniref:hypothetical protein n=1 Tax=Micrococcus antarcticus TaxID=86171 RepID=UPI00384D927D